MSWKIAKNKIHGATVEPKITQDEWEEIVDKDRLMTWFDDTYQGSKFFDGFEKEGVQKPRRRVAHYKYDLKKGYSLGLFIWTPEGGYISIDATPFSLNKVRKIFEVAEKLNANVYKTGVLKKRDYLEKMEEKARNKKK